MFTLELPTGPGWRVERYQTDHCAGGKNFAARCFDYRPGSGPDHEHELLRFGDRPGDVDCSDLPATRRQLPELARSIHYFNRTYWRARGRDLGTAYHKHNTKRAGNDGRDHVYGCRHREFRIVVTFARQRLAEGIDPVRAAWEAGSTRLRPVLMTALAMIIGMLPMSLGLGEGGEQNAPLGRGVIGGLMIATVATLFFVPVVFSFLHRLRQHRRIQNPKRQIRRKVWLRLLLRLSHEIPYDYNDS